MKCFSTKLKSGLKCIHIYTLVILRNKYNKKQSKVVKLCELVDEQDTLVCDCNI